MIKTLAHARRVQARRKAAGKRGVAGAVKRWTKRTGSKARLELD